jgi:hypothetical protein
MEAMDDYELGVAGGKGDSAMSEDPEADDSRTFDQCSLVSINVGSSS